MFTALLAQRRCNSICAHPHGQRGLTVSRPGCLQLQPVNRPSTSSAIYAKARRSKLEDHAGGCDHRTICKTPKHVHPVNVVDVQDISRVLEVLQNCGHFKASEVKDAILSFYRWLTFKVNSKHAIMYNMKGTANDRTTPLAGVKFWIEFIRAVLGIDRSTEIVCSVDGCVDCNGRASLATDGGHVMLQSGPGDCCTGYPVLAPLCPKHNRSRQTGPLPIREGAYLIWLPPHMSWHLDNFLPDPLQAAVQSIQSIPAVLVKSGLQEEGAIWNTDTTLISPLHATTYQGAGLPVVAVAAAAAGRGSLELEYGGLSVWPSAKAHPLRELLQKMFQQFLCLSLDEGPSSIEGAGVKFVHDTKILAFYWLLLVPYMTAWRCSE